jgi:hypothetical protein
VRYGCNPGIEPGVCFETPGGEFDDKETCDTNCRYIPHLFKCMGDSKCELDPSGTFKSEAECLVGCGAPPPPPPPPSEYRCENDKCVEAEKGVDVALCKSACEPSWKQLSVASGRGLFVCAEGKVVPSHVGVELEEVQALCGPVSPEM